MKKIVLIACVKSKHKYPAKAKELYKSTLFQSNLQYAYQLKPDAIYILSAKYELLDLDQVIFPYEMTLNSMTEAEKMSWSRMVLDILQKKADLKSDLFVILAGTNYRKYLLPELTHYEIPLEGLSFGRQLQELKRRIS
jgi:hypothetical protein